MPRSTLSILVAAIPALASAQQPASAPVPSGVAADLNPRAAELFQSDEVLMRWALRFHDSNGDGHLSLIEAQPAVKAFKKFADGDGDGRVTTYELGRAREFIIARDPPVTASN